MRLSRKDSVKPCAAHARPCAVRWPQRLGASHDETVPTGEGLASGEPPPPAMLAPPQDEMREGPLPEGLQDSNANR
jgi:hypothetical protein